MHLKMWSGKWLPFCLSLNINASYSRPSSNKGTTPTWSRSRRSMRRLSQPSSRPSLSSGRRRNSLEPTSPLPRTESVSTVGTPYNTAPYITGSNIARLGHGSQNSWSQLWIPIVKSAPVRVIFKWISVPKKSIHGSSDIYLGTQWKQRHDSPWSYRSDVIVTFLWYGTIGIIWHRDHQSTAKKV